jgi:hypothetical protein
MEWIPYQGMESPVTVGHIVTGSSRSERHRSTDRDRSPGKADKTTTSAPIPWDMASTGINTARPTKEGLSKLVGGPIIRAGNVVK